MSKSKILNIIIIVLALALIVFLLVGKKKDAAKAPVDDNSASSETTNPNTTPAVVVPTPAADSWKSTTIVSGPTFDIPNDYYVSHPVIDECNDVTSISTQTATVPTISVALVYKDGCVKNPDVTDHYTKREVKNGYVFQTSSKNASVLAIFDHIVASVK